MADNKFVHFGRDFESNKYFCVRDDNDDVVMKTFNAWTFRSDDNVVPIARNATCDHCRWQSIRRALWWMEMKAHCGQSGKLLHLRNAKIIGM